MPLEYIHKISRNYLDYGFRITAKKLFAEILKPVIAIKQYRLYGITLPQKVRTKRALSDFEYKCITSYDKDIISQIEQVEEWLHGKISSKIESGGICLVAMDKVRLAGFNIVNFDEIDIPLVKYRKALKDNEAFSEQITVLKKYRGKGLASSIRYAIFDELSNRGITKFYGAAQRNNTASLRLAKKVGFSFLRDITFLKVFFFNTIFFHRSRYDNKQEH